MNGYKRRRECGLALVMVLWLVAAMSLLVASVVYLARTDVQQQQLAQHVAKASAVADKAMRLSMRQYVLNVAEGGLSNQLAQQYSFDDAEFSGVVDIYPASGLIHLGSLTPELLLAVLRHGVGLADEQMEALGELLGSGFASATFDGKDVGLPNRFRVLEDLLLIPGVSIDSYEILKDYFYVGQSGAPGVNPAAAPRELLSVLAGGDTAVVDEFMSLREEARQSVSGEVLAHPQFAAGIISSANSSVYRVDVTLSFTNRRAFRQRYWLSLLPSQEGLPWMLLAKDPIRAVAVQIQ